MTGFGKLTPRLPVKDLARTIAFYENLLGFTRFVSWPENEPTFVILECGAASIGFFPVDASRVRRVGYAELYLRTGDVAALHASVRETIEVEWGPEVYSYGCKEFGIRDPDDYLIIFSEPTDEAPTTREPA